MGVSEWGFPGTYIHVSSENEVKAWLRVVFCRSKVYEATDAARNQETYNILYRTPCNRYAKLGFSVTQKKY